MENQNYIYLNRKAVLAAIIAAAFPMVGYAAAGRVEFATGGATIQGADGTSRTMTKGMEISQGDTILTGSGRAQVKFSDGAYISFQPNTQFKIEEYNYNGKQDGTERGFFRLVEGGLRALTGLVGRENRPNYRMATPVATIGIRGSYYLAEFREKLKAHVGHGSIYVFNDQGDIILFQGQGAVVEHGKAPGYSDEDMKLGAKGPDGGQPKDTKEEQQAQIDNSEVFKVSEQYTNDGMPTSLGDNSGIVASLIANGAVGYYHLDTSASGNAYNVGGGSVTNGSTTYSYVTKLTTADINIYFGQNYVDGNITTNTNVTTTIANSGSFTNTGLSDSFNLYSGQILSNGAFFVSGSTASSGGICSGSCNMNVTGLVGGTQGEKATISYAIQGVSTGAIIGGHANLVANPPAPPITNGQ